jgi:hypothetical protein
MDSARKLAFFHGCIIFMGIISKRGVRVSQVWVAGRIRLL